MPSAFTCGTMPRMAARNDRRSRSDEMTAKAQPRPGILKVFDGAIKVIVRAAISAQHGQACLTEGARPGAAVGFRRSRRRGRISPPATQPATTRLRSKPSGRVVRVAKQEQPGPAALSTASQAGKSHSQPLSRAPAARGRQAATTMAGCGQEGRIDGRCGKYGVVLPSAARQATIDARDEARQPDDPSGSIVQPKWRSR